MEDLKDEDNFWKRLTRERFWYGNFFGIPFVTWLFCTYILKSSELITIVLVFASFLIYLGIFVLSGIYKEV